MLEYKNAEAVLHIHGVYDSKTGTDNIIGRKISMTRFSRVKGHAQSHDFLYIDDLDEDAVLELISNVCENYGLPADKYRDHMLKDEYARRGFAAAAWVFCVLRSVFGCGDRVVAAGRVPSVRSG